MAILNREIAEAMKTPRVTDRLVPQGLIPIGSNSADFAAFQEAEIAKNGRIIKDANIKLSEAEGRMSAMAFLAMDPATFDGWPDGFFLPVRDQRAGRLSRYVRRSLSFSQLRALWVRAPPFHRDELAKWPNPGAVRSQPA